MNINVTLTIRLDAVTVTLLERFVQDREIQAPEPDEPTAPTQPTDIEKLFINMLEGNEVDVIQ
jgi:hypothetical protein